MVARLIIAALLLSSCAFATNNCDIGIDFRSTLGYVTDPSYAIANLAETTAQTKTSSSGCPITYQWMTNVSSNSRDRNNTTDDVRLAGMVFISSGQTGTELRITNQTAGTYTVGVAMGDAGSLQCSGVACSVAFKDGTGGTTLLTVTNGGSAIGSNSFYDATSVTRTAAAWPGSNATGTITTTGTTISIVFTTGANLPIAHIRLTPAGGPPPGKHTLTLTGAGPS